MKLINQIIVVVGLVFIVACSSDSNQKTEEIVVEKSEEIVWQQAI